MNVRLFQIYYDDETRRSLDPGFTPLSNVENTRPDWFEYWPIRRTLVEGRFGEEDYIGFFSPKFSEKTNSSAREVIEACHGRDDPILSFSPYFDQSAVHRNPFEQGERHHAGLTEIAQQFVDRCGLELDLTNLVSDHTTTIFSNYFVARYWVWREWFSLSESLFDLCENADDELARRLRGQTVHRHGSYPMKVFLMERLITVLMESRGWAARLCLDIPRMPPGWATLMRAPGGLAVCDALKGQYRRTGNPFFIDSFERYRVEVLRTIKTYA